MRASLRLAPLAAVCLLLACATAALAETGAALTIRDYRERLPADTIFYLSWEGLENLDSLRASNPALRFILSSEMKENWANLEEYYRQRRARGKELQDSQEAPVPTAQERMDHLLTVLRNPGFLAIVPPAPPEAIEPALVFLYDTRGIDDVLTALLDRPLKVGETRRKYVLDGVTFTETVGSKGKEKHYVARIGNLLVGGNNKEAAEAWVRTVQQPPAHGLKDVAAYQEAQSRPEAGGQLDAFLNFAALGAQANRLPMAASPEIEGSQIADALGLTSWRWAGFGLSVEPERTRYNLALVGKADADAAPSILGPNVTDFPSLDYAPADALNYSVGEINLSALLSSLRRAAALLVPPDKVALVDGFQGMLEGTMGITLDEFAEAWGTEFASITYPIGDGQVATLRAVKMEHRDRVETLLNKVLPLVGQAEINESPLDGDEGTVTYIKLTPQADKEEADGSDDAELRAALTDSWFLQSSSEAALQRAVQGHSAPGLRTNPDFQQARARFPAKLISFSYTDAARWAETEDFAELVRMIAQGMAERVEGEESHQAEDEGALPEEDPPQPQDEEAADLPEIKIPRGYLKRLLSAARREGRSIHLTGTIE